jgi:hypothetical protein
MDKVQKPSNFDFPTPIQRLASQLISLYITHVEEVLLNNLKNNQVKSYLL